MIIKEGITVEVSDAKTIANRSAADLISKCKSNARSKLLDASDPITVLDSLSACVEKGVALEIERANEEIAFQAEIRRSMGGMIENYTCADMTLNTTDPKSTQMWGQMKVNVMIDRPAAKIHVIEDFLTHEECEAVKEQATPKLHDATVADGSGGSKLSPNRKAKQAGIKVH